MEWYDVKLYCGTASDVMGSALVYLFPNFHLGTHLLRQFPLPPRFPQKEARNGNCARQARSQIEIWERGTEGCALRT